MNKKTLASLVILFSAVCTSTVYAQRPAEDDDSQSNIPAPVTEPMDVGRPAASSKMPPAMTEETQTSGDVMTMPQANESTTEAVASRVRQLDFPRRGMTQDKVQNELGRPSEIVPAVGTPPISRWVYDDRIVYFEYSAVIHVVAK